MAERRRMANLQAGVPRIDKQVGGRVGSYHVDSTRPASWLPEDSTVFGEWRWAQERCLEPYTL